MKINNDVKVPCSICGNDISKFFGKFPMGICESCKRLYCPNCVKSLKKDNCTKCGNKIFKTKSIMKQLPEGWRGSGGNSQEIQGLKPKITPEK